MSDIKIQGVVEMSSEGAERSFDRLGQKADEMSRKVTQTSAQAGQAVDQIGTGANRNADEFTRAEGRIVSSIKRATTELQNLGKTASQRLELRIDTQGLDRAKFEPLLANLRELEAAQQRVVGTSRGFGNGLQNASFQLQDFIVQVNGGTDATRALAMQLPQMLVGFGAIGAGIGVVAALLPNMIALFGDSANEADSLKDAMSGMDDAISQVGRTVRTFDMEGLYEEFNSASTATRAATIEQLNFQRAFIETQRLVSQKAFSESLSGIGDFSFLDKLSGGGTAASRVADDLGVTLDVAERLAPVLKGLRDGTEDVGSAFTRFGTQLLSGNKDAVALATAMRDLANGEKDAYAASSALSEALERMAKGHVRTKKETDEAAKASKAYADETQRMAEAARELVASLLGQSSGLSADFFKKWETLGQAYKAGAISLQDLTNAQAALLAQQPAMKQAAKDAEDYGKALASTVGALEDRALALEAELANYGLTKAEIERTTIARLEEVRAMEAANGATDEYLRNVDREIEARKRIASATAGIEVADANRKAAEKAAQEWERTANAIEDALIDALMEGGKSGAEYIEGLFRAMVLRPIVQAIVAPIAGQVTGALGFGGQAQGSGGFGLSPTSLIPGSALGSAALWAGSALGTGTLAGGFLTGFGTSLASGAGTLGSLSAGASLFGTAGGGAAGAGMIAGAALPWVGGALALASLFGAFDKKPSDKSAWATINPLTGALSDVGSMTGKKDPGQQARDQTAQLAQFLAGFAADAGINRALTVMTGQRDGFRVDLAGGLRTPTAPRGNGGYGYNFGAVGEDAFKRILNDLVDEGTLPQATIDAWRQMRTDAQGAARDAQEQMDVLDLLVQGISAAEIERANIMQQAGETLAEAYARMVAVENAIRAGISEAFDSPAERLASAFQSLGVTIPQTAEAYEQIVRSQDLTTEAGRNLAVSLLQAKALWDEAQRQQELSIREAQTALERAYSGEAGRLSGVIDQFVSLSASLKGFRDSLNAQSLDEQTRATLAAQQFRDVSSRAQLGDVAAMESLASVSTEYLETVRNSASTAEDYARALAQVQAAVGGAIDVADRQSAIAQAQLDALTAQVGALIDIDDSVLSVRDAIIALQNVMAGNPATATQSQTVASSAPLAQQQAGAVIAQSSDTNQSTGASIGFVTSETLVTELQALRAEVIELRASAESTARNTHTTQRILDRVTRGGDAMLTEAAA